MSKDDKKPVYFTPHIPLQQSTVFKTLNDTLQLVVEAFKEIHTKEWDFFRVLYLKSIITSFTTAMRVYKESFHRFRQQCITQQLPQEFISNMRFQNDLDHIVGVVRGYDPPHELAIHNRLPQIYSSSKLISCAYDTWTHTYKVVVSVPIRPQAYELTLLKLTPLPFMYDKHPHILYNLPARVVRGVKRINALPSQTPFTKTLERFTYSLNENDNLECTSILCFLPNLHSLTYPSSQCVYHIIFGGSPTDFDACEVQQMTSSLPLITKLPKNQVAIASNEIHLLLRCNHTTFQVKHSLPRGFLLFNLRCDCHIYQPNQESSFHKGIIYPSSPPCFDFYDMPQIYTLIPILLRDNSEGSDNSAFTSALTLNQSMVNSDLSNLKTYKPTTVYHLLGSDSGLYNLLRQGLNRMNLLLLSIDFVYLILFLILFYYVNRILGLLSLLQPVACLDELDPLLCTFPLYLEIFINFVCILVMGFILLMIFRKLARPLDRLYHSIRRRNNPTATYRSTVLHQQIQTESSLGTSQNIPPVPELEGINLLSQWRGMNMDTPPMLQPLMLKDAIYPAFNTSKCESMKLLPMTHLMSDDEAVETI